MKKVIRLLGAAAFCLVVSAGAWAQDAAAGSAPPVDETTLSIGDAPADAGAGASGGSILPYILRMVVVLGLVIAVIYGLYALLRRSARPRTQDDPYLRVLASVQLGAGRNLHVVSLGDRAWLLGSTDSSVSLVSEVNDRELVDTLTLRAEAAPEAPRKDFATVLGELLRQRPAGSARKGDAAGQAAKTADFFARQRDRLKKF